MKHKSKQVEITWGEAEPFALVVETTSDGDSMAARKDQSQADKQAAEQQQPKLI